jgi:hypothetical protein
MQLILVQIAQQISSRWSDRPSKIVIEVFVKIFLFESNRFGPSTFLEETKQVTKYMSVQKSLQMWGATSRPAHPFMLVYSKIFMFVCTVKVWLLKSPCVFTVNIWQLKSPCLFTVSFWIVKLFKNVVVVYTFCC